MFRSNLEEAIEGDPYLVPVYFNKEVLVRYLYDPRFRCDFVSETYGVVESREFRVPFGINSNGSVFLWRGDLLGQMPKRERLYWLLENKEPERNVASQFFEAQINGRFTEPPVAVAFLNAWARLDASFNERFCVHLYRITSLEERIDQARRYSRLLLNNVDDFKRALSELNEIVNEATSNTELRQFLTSQGLPRPAVSKGNKLLEVVYKRVLGDTENLIAPFFWLYELRLWADHAGLDETRDVVAAALGVENVADGNALMKRLLEALTEACRKLEGRIGDCGGRVA